MSNQLSIAAVTATLHSIVQTAVAEAVPGVTVRIGSPRAILPSETEVCLYLYHITPNASLQNGNLPVHGSHSLPPKSQTVIDLHYLIACIGEQHLATEIMLGNIIIALAQRSVLDAETIRGVIQADGDYGFLKDCDLLSSPSLVRLIPTYPTLDEMTRLWSACFQTAYRPSLHVLATPIILETEGALAQPQVRLQSG